MAATVYLLIVSAALVYLWNGSRRRRGLPKGPPTIPFIGNWLPWDNVTLHKQVTQWSKKYGDIYTYMVGRNPVIVLSSPEALDDLCVKRGGNYSSRPVASRQAFLVTRDERLTNIQYNDKWRKHRKILHTLLGIQAKKYFEPYQDFESRLMLKTLLDQPENFAIETKRYAASVAFSLILGARFDRADHPLIHTIEHNLHRLMSHIIPGKWLVDWVPALDLLPEPLAPWRQKARNFYAEHLGFWLVFYRNMCGRVEDKTAPDCFLTRLINQLNEKKDFTLEESEAAIIMGELLTAGSSTTASFLVWFFKAAAKNPAAIEAANEEIERIVGRDSMPGWEDRKNLPYVTSLIMEVHRWSSMSPLSFMHCTSADDNYRGMKIPKDTAIQTNIYGVHNDPTVFSDPEKFLPERWLDKADPRHIPGGTRVDSHYGYGIGRRICPGMHVAEASLYIAISRLIWAYKFGETSGSPIEDREVGTLPVLGPAPFQCTITPRGLRVAEMIRKATADASGHVLEDANQYQELLLAQGRA